MPNLTPSFLRSFARFVALVALCGGVPGGALAAGVWVRQSAPSLAWLRSVHFIDARRGWAAGGGGTLLRTVDGGARWERLPRPTEDAVRDVRFVDDLHGWLLCEPDLFALKTKTETRSYILRTTDGGKTWTRSDPSAADPDLRLTRVRFVNRMTGWTFGESGALYSTQDGGATWQRHSFESRLLLLDASFLDARQGWLVGGGGMVWRTADAGATWRASRVRGFADAPFTSSSASARTMPVGAAQAATNSRLYAVAFADARRGWTIGADGQVWTTANGGAAWTRQTSGTDADLLGIAFLNSHDGWAVGAAGTLISTNDGGRTWTTEETRTTHRLESVSVAPGGYVWAVGFGGAILHHAPQNAPARPQLKTGR